MGKLRDIINARAKGKEVEYKLNVEETLLPSPLQVEAEEQVAKNKFYYNDNWLSKVALHRGYAVNPDGGKVSKILAALNRRGGYCPCGGTGEQFKCPCEIMRNHGICKCGLFQNVPDRKVTGSTTGARIERD